MDKSKLKRCLRWDRQRCNHVCFPCRTVNRMDKKCPRCGADTVNIGYRCRPPGKDDARGWKRLERYLQKKPKPFVISHDVIKRPKKKKYGGVAVFDPSNRRYLQEQKKKSVIVVRAALLS